MSVKGTAETANLKAAAKVKHKAKLKINVCCCNFAAQQHYKIKTHTINTPHNTIILMWARYKNYKVLLILP